MTNTVAPVQQGEIMLVPIAEADIPLGTVSKHTTFTVSPSTTGHPHVLESKSKFEVISADKDAVYLRLIGPAKLVHKKEHDFHKTLVVEPGTYKVAHKIEYDPFKGIIRKVQD